MKTVLKLSALNEQYRSLHKYIILKNARYHANTKLN